MSKPRIRVKAHLVKTNVLRLVPRPQPVFDPEAVVMCEQLIARIKAGEVLAIGFCTTIAGGGFSTGWSGWAGDMAGPAAMLVHRLADASRSV